MNFEFTGTVKEAVGKYRNEMFAAERYIWKNPQTGYKEWKANNYLKDAFRRLGYSDFIEAGDIPGFYFDIDTGRQGPTFCVIGELDSVICAEHPESDPETGAVHACGHNCQTAGLIGVAGALKDERLLNRMNGKVRIMAVPAEEGLELAERSQMRRDGIIHYFNGKTEMAYRKFFDDVDLAMMIHGGGSRKDGKPFLHLHAGCNGAIMKEIYYTGKASHATDGYHAINALSAARIGLAAVDALREKFIDERYVRFHPIITEGGQIVNAIPSRVKIETFVRALELDTMREVNDMVNRALTAGALAIGANIEIVDLDANLPEKCNPALSDVVLQVGCDLLGEDRVTYRRGEYAKGSTDMGNLSYFIPTCQPLGCGGSVGLGHGANYYVTDPEQAVAIPAMVNTATAVALLENDAARAKEIIAGFKPIFPNAKAMMKAIDEICTVKHPIEYGDRSASVNWS